MAAPHVAGAAALLLSYRPELTPTQVESLLISTTKPTASATATTPAAPAPAGGSTAALAGDVPLIELPWIGDDHPASGGDADDPDLDDDHSGDDDSDDDAPADLLTITAPAAIGATSAVRDEPQASGVFQDAQIPSPPSAVIAPLVLSHPVDGPEKLTPTARVIDDLAEPSSLGPRLRHRRGRDNNPLALERRAESRKRRGLRRSSP
jgi:hypothetical protein